jgi:hypothetical protein
VAQETVIPPPPLAAPISYSENDLAQLMSSNDATSGHRQCSDTKAKFLFFKEGVFVLGRDTTHFDYDLYNYTEIDLRPEIKGPVDFRKFKFPYPQDLIDDKIKTICLNLHDKVTCQIFSVIMGNILNIKEKELIENVENVPVCFNEKCLQGGEYNDYTRFIRSVVGFMFESGYDEMGSNSFKDKGSEKYMHWGRWKSMFYFYCSSNPQTNAIGFRKTNSGIYAYPGSTTLHSYYIPFYDEITFRTIVTICNYDTLNKFEDDLFDDSIPSPKRWKHISDIMDFYDCDVGQNMRLHDICKVLKRQPPDACIIITKFMGGLSAEQETDIKIRDPYIDIQDQERHVYSWKISQYDLILVSKKMK